MWQDEWKRWQKELAARDPEALRELEAQSDEEKLEAFAGKMAFGTGQGCARSWAWARRA